MKASLILLATIFPILSFAMNSEVRNIMSETTSRFEIECQNGSRAKIKGLRFLNEDWTFTENVFGNVTSVKLGRFGTKFDLQRAEVIKNSEGEIILRSIITDDDNAVVHNYCDTFDKPAYYNGKVVQFLKIDNNSIQQFDRYGCGAVFHPSVSKKAPENWNDEKRTKGRASIDTRRSALNMIYTGAASDVEYYTGGGKDSGEKRVNICTLKPKSEY